MLVATDMTTNDPNKGQISFVDKANTSKVLCGMRIQGTPQAKLIIDAANSSNGLSFRSSADQGSTTEGGKGLPYSFELSGSYTRSTVPVDITETNKQTNPTSERGFSYLNVNRYGTSGLTTVTVPPQARYVSLFLQTVYRTDEEIYIGFGTQFQHRAVWIYNDTTKKSSLALTTSQYNEPVKSLTWDAAGNVNIPVKLVAENIYANTYENLPPIPDADLLPLTLDKAHDRVGINETVPQYELDVNGSARITNGMEVENGIQTSSVEIIALNPGEGLIVSGDIVFLGLQENLTSSGILSYDPTSGDVDYIPKSSFAPDLLPITLDKTNNRVGINNTSPTQSLDIVGNGTINGFLAVRESNAIEFGAGIPGKERDSGKIWYDTTAGELFLIGAGGFPNRKIKLWDHVTANGSIKTESNLYLFGGDSNALSAQGGDLSTVAVGKTDPIPPTSTGAVAIGKGASVGNGSVAIGLEAGGGQGAYSIAIGNGCGEANQGANTVAVGFHAGNLNQTEGGVAVGFQAGQTGQGANTVALGRGSGSLTQGELAISIGYNAGTSTQSKFAVAIGPECGKTNQGEAAIAIGIGAGYANQGRDSIAIGRGAGQGTMHATSIVLNATGTEVNSTGVSSFYVKPIRNLVDATLTNLSYNPTTGEITYGNAGGGSTNLAPLTLDATNKRVGIDQPTPTKALDVTGDARITGSLETAGIPPLRFSTDKRWVAIGETPKDGVHLKVGVFEADQFEADTWQFNINTYYSSGPGNPEGTTIAGIGSMWTRTDPTGTNDIIYYKTVNDVGGDTTKGWLPLQIQPTPFTPTTTIITTAQLPIVTNVTLDVCSTTVATAGTYAITGSLIINQLSSDVNRYQFRLHTGSERITRTIDTTVIPSTNFLEDSLTRTITLSAGTSVKMTIYLPNGNGYVASTSTLSLVRLA